MQARTLLVNVARVVFAVTTVVAMTYQFASLRTTLPAFNPGNFFSFFTIESDILAAALLFSMALIRRDERTLLFDLVRGAVTLYIAITGVVFAILLRGLQESLDTHIGWVDFTVHKLIPVVVVADWVWDPPRHRLPIAASVSWLIYPALWLTYTLVRGASEDWYPYPFVDASHLGYGGVLLRSALLVVGFAAGAAALIAIGNWRRGQAQRRPAGAAVAG